MSVIISREISACNQLQQLARGYVRTSTAATTLPYASTTVSDHTATTVPATRRAAKSDSKSFPPGGNSHGLDDLVNTEKMVSEAREELAGLKHEVEEAREEVITCWGVLLCMGTCAETSLNL